ncbi:MAG: peptidyl-alpha-hydroxyglycine alpha-amidating lyase family protein [Syntrophorhabdales bacterium]
MSIVGRVRFGIIAAVAVAIVLALTALTAFAQQGVPSSAKPPNNLPNPYRLVTGWPTLPATMVGPHGHKWGEVIRVHVAPDGNIWVFQRCFNDQPNGDASCLRRGQANPPILQFDPLGKLLKTFGVGLFAHPHGFTVDPEGNLWASDTNDEEVILGIPAKNANGVLLGQEVLKLGPSGMVMMVLGKYGVSGNGPDTFDRPNGIAVAKNGDIFVADGHYPNKHNNGRIVKFSKDGKFIKAWGKVGTAPGEFDEPHDLCIGGTEQRLYVADRRNNRIQVFDQDGKYITSWLQFGQPSSVYVDKNDNIFVGSLFQDPAAPQGQLRGIVIGSVKDGSLKAFIPDPYDLDTLTDTGTSASGVAEDEQGNIYAGDVGANNLRKYECIKKAPCL